MAFISIIIILVLILVIILLVYCGVRALQKKTREVSQTLFGTEHITEAAEKMRVENATTPKSVASMTNLLLPKIATDFPEFHYDEMKERAENVLTGYLQAINAQNSSLLKDGNTELKQELEHHLQSLYAQGKQEHFENVRIHRTEINQYRKAAGRCTITFQSSLECFHYITEDTSDRIEGSKNYKYQTRYNVDLIYIQDRNLVENDLDHALGLNCPNCGAPLSSLGAKVCEYCGTPIIEYNIRTWTFSHVEEVQ